MKRSLGGPIAASLLICLMTSARADSLEMRHVGSWPFGTTYALAVDSLRELAFVGSGAGVIVVDVSNPEEPIPVSDEVRARSRVVDLEWRERDSVLFVLTRPDAGSELAAWDIRDPESPRLLGHIELGASWHSDLLVAGNLAFVSGSSFQIVDVSDPANPGVLCTAGSFGGRSMAASGTLVFLAGRRFWVLSVADPTNPVEVSSLDWTLFECVLRGDLLYATCWDDRHQDGIVTIDVSSPHEPRVASFQHHYFTGGMDVTGNLLVFGCEGLRVCDLSDPARPAPIGYCRALSRETGMVAVGSLVFTTSYQDFNSTRGLRAFDCTDPTDPVCVGHWVSPHMSVDVALAGDYALVANGEGGLRVIDLADRAHPDEVSSLAVDDAVTAIEIEGDHAYLGRHLGELEVVHIADPTNPTSVSVLQLPGSVYDLDCRDTLLFTASYGGGLRVLDIVDPESPVEIGVWDSAHVFHVDVQGQYAYTDARGDLTVFDVSDPSSPAAVAVWGLDEWYCGDVDVEQGLACASFGRGITGGSLVVLLDVSDPANPVPLCSTYWRADRVEVRWPYVFTVGAAVGVLDIRNSETLELVASYDLPGWFDWEEPRGIAVDGNQIVVACDDNGLQLLEATSIGIEERALELPMAAEPSSTLSRGVLRLPAGVDAVLLDASGRRVMELPGSSASGALRHHDVRHLVPGVYFLRSAIDNRQSGIVKVIVTR